MPGKVRVIPANTNEPIKHVVIYARVSSNTMDQLESLKAQVSELTKFVSGHNNWKLVDIHIDIASAKKDSVRPAFHNMIEECKAGLTDIVVVKSIVGKKKRVNQYALVKLHFMKRDDLNDGLEIEANSSKLLIDAKILRQYFGIEYQNNLGDILKQFTETFGKAIPMNIPKNISDEEKGAMVKSLSISDSENPNKIYCYKIRRNPSGGKRSDFNSDKTKLLRSGLFRKFEN